MMAGYVGCKAEKMIDFAMKILFIPCDFMLDKVSNPILRFFGIPIALALSLTVFIIPAGIIEIAAAFVFLYELANTPPKDGL